MGGLIVGRSLSDLKGRAKSLPTRNVPLCLDQELLAEIQRLDAERAEVMVEHHRQRQDELTDDGEQKRPRRMTESNALPPRAVEIDAELEALYDRMRESEGDLLLRAISPQRWQGWKDANPARENNKSDDEMVYGLCDSTALLADLGRYAASWDGENFGPTDWDDYFADLVAPGDMFELCRQVVQMHEVRVTVPGKRLSASSAAPMSESA